MTTNATLSPGMARWQGKVALVTGASSGIGRATAKALATAGMRLALAARRFERLEQLQAELPESTDVLLQQTDLRNEDDITALFQAIRTRWGGVDVLVNNAGLGHNTPLTSTDPHAPAQWREMLEVNVLALCLCTREAVQDMRKRGDDGHVFHISSMSAHRVPSGSGVYSATKYAVRSLTEGLRLELREQQSHIRVTAISPGYVETEFAAVYHKSEEAAAQTYSQFQVLEAEDIANSVLYALGSPPHMQVHDILIRPTQQAS